MNTGRIRTALLFPVLACCVLVVTCAEAKADLSSKQAGNALRRTAGAELKRSAVRVKSIAANSGSAASVIADIRTVFKFETDAHGQWHIAEISLGQDRWEDINLVARALGTQATTAECNAPDPPFKGKSGTDPSVKRARCLLAGLLGVDLPSDAVRIQEVDPFPLLLASQASAVVITWLRVEARLSNVKSGWQVTELRTGNHEWINLESLAAAINQQKQLQVRTELAFIAVALEKFRRDRGFYVVSDKQAVAIDFLSPRYLSRIIRLDPWHKPYQYLGQRDHFTLRSSGPDGKVDTADDIELASPSQ
jgi:cell division protein FtsL